MIKYLILFSFIFSLSCKNTNNQTSQTDGGLTWLTIEEADKLIASGTNQKKFLVDVYTDWCGWCKVMDKKTFTDPTLIKYLNENFHVVKFNAEQKETISFKGKEFTYQSMGNKGVNMLGIELLQGNLAYPTLVYLDKDLNSIKVSPGYKKPEELMTELQSL